MAAPTAHQLPYPVDERQIRQVTRTPTLITHSALPVQNAFEQPPVYTPLPSNGALNWLNTSVPVQTFSPHHPLRPIGGPVSPVEDAISESPMGLTASVGTPATLWGREWEGRFSQNITETSPTANMTANMTIDTVDTTHTANRSSRSLSHSGIPGRRISSMQRVRAQTASTSTWETSNISTTPGSRRWHSARRATREEIERVPTPAAPLPIHLDSYSFHQQQQQQWPTVKTKTPEPVTGEYEDDMGGGGQAGREGKRPARWRQWSSPAIMTTCLIVAVSFSLGHHAYFTALDGTAARDTADQQRPVQCVFCFFFLPCRV